jgi:mono/diheme cytochrome c family protein
MRTLKLQLSPVLVLFAGIHPALAQVSENGQRLSERWCSECHAIDTYRKAPSFAAIAARPAVTADMIASFLLLPHATMPNLPTSRKDAQDIAAFIIATKK